MIGECQLVKKIYRMNLGGELLKEIGYESTESFCRRVQKVIRDPKINFSGKGLYTMLLMSRVKEAKYWLQSDWAEKATDNVVSVRRTYARLRETGLIDRFQVKEKIAGKTGEGISIWVTKVKLPGRSWPTPSHQKSQTDFILKSLLVDFGEEQVFTELRLFFQNSNWSFREKGLFACYLFWGGKAMGREAMLPYISFNDVRWIDRLMVEINSKGVMLPYKTVKRALQLVNEFQK
ncbi:hypothetical protein B2D45_01705 [Lactobacillus hilgardii]